MAGLAARYLVERGRSERSWPLLVESRLRDIGEVDEVSVLPLVQPGSPTPCERSQVNSSIPASAKHKHGPHPPHAQVILRRA
jgi:hypothetical protein